jgi:hypothetical protein
MTFIKGKPKSGGIRKGQKHKKTMLREKLGLETIKNINQFSEILLENWYSFITSPDGNIRLIATKELSKFVFPSLRTIETSIKPKTIEDFLLEIQKGENDFYIAGDESERHRLEKS